MGRSVSESRILRKCGTSAGVFTTPHIFYSFHSVTEAKLKATILKSKPTSCSLDPVLTSLLLEFIDDLLPTLTYIINFSLSSGTFPSTFRSAVDKLLLKKASLDSNN